MKIAVYAICKNEEKHIERWLASASEADAIYVLDTGSEDKSVSMLQDRVNLHTAGFHPFRFDIARNMIANQIPADFDLAVFMDMDEVLEPGWRAKIESISVPYDALNFNMIFNRDAAGVPSTVYHRLMAHRPHAYVWHYPVHEVLVPVNGNQDTVVNTDIYVEHLPDPDKERSSYLELLKLGVEELPNDPRMRQYLGREFMYREEYGAAIVHLEMHVKMSDNPIATAESYRYLANCYWSIDLPHMSEKCYFKAIAACPDQREAYAELSYYYRVTGNVEASLAFALACLNIPETAQYMIREQKYYREWPHHMAAWAYSELGASDLAVQHIERAIKLAPTNPYVISDFVSLTGKLPPQLAEQIANNNLQVSVIKESVSDD